MKKTLAAGLLIFLSQFIKGLFPYRKTSMDLTKLKLSIWYLQSIKTFRLLFISLLGAGACLVFLIISLILFHIAILFYVPWSMEVKMYVTFICAAIYLFMAWFIFSYIFAEDKWLKIFNADKMMREVSDSLQSEVQPEEKTTSRVSA